MPETVTLAPGITVPAPEDGEELRYSEDDAQIVRRFFSLLVFGQNEWAGRPFRLESWEAEAIDNFYGVQVRDDAGDWVRYRRFLYEELPKKNGKSEFAAGLGLYHLIADGEQLPRVGLFATDKVNADIIYQCAKYMVEHTALGQPVGNPLVWCRDSVREIRTRYGGVLKVYSSDVENKHGFSFSAIIIDELHTWAKAELWDVLTAGSDAARRQQAVIVLTTAGDDPDRKSIGWIIHEKCRRILAWREGHPERELDQDDPQWLPIMYGISVLTGDEPDAIAELDIYDEALWRRCNPSYGVTIKPRQFRAEARAARQSEAAERTFRWLRLNQWIATAEVGWVPLTLYDKTQWNRPEWAGLSAPERRRAVREYLRGKRCYAGLDLSTTTDLSALVLCFPPQPGLETWVALFWAWRPLDGVIEAEQRDHVPYRDWARAGFLELCEGDMNDFTQIEDTVKWCAATFKLLKLGVDPYLSRTLTQRLAATGVELMEIPQTLLGMSPATKELERLIRGHEMLHEHSTACRFCFGNIRCITDANENMRPTKKRSIGRIDIVVAWIICMAAAMVDRAKPPDLAAAIEAGTWSM